MTMLPRKLKEVYVQHFNEEVKIEERLTVENEEERYVYQINHQNTIYILKDFRIQLKQRNSNDKEAA